MFLGEKSNKSLFDKSPWDNSPKNSDNESFEELLRKAKNYFPKFNFSNNNSSLIYIVAAAIALWFATGFYIIEEKEQAVVLRFGKYVRSSVPGLNYHLPYPVEEVTKERVNEIRVEEIGTKSPNVFTNPTNQRNLAPRPIARKANNEESLMLTGDENIVDINFQVQWKINSLRNYLFNVQNARDTVRNTAESAMREIIGNTPISEAQTYGKAVIEQRAKDLMQQILDNYDSGIEIYNLKLLKVDPPVEVIDAHRDVQAARADKEREINQAQSYLNDILPKARGEAAKIIQDGEAYAKEVTERATGESSRFNAVYEEFKKDKSLTRKRMYYETMEKVLGNLDKVIIDSSKNSNILPYLALPQLDKKN